MIRGNLSVRGLAEFVCRGGDLYPPRAGRQVEREEGVVKQRQAQQRRAAGCASYQREVPVQLEFACGGETRQLNGRMDGLSLAAGTALIEEFKCCGELPDAVDPIDLGQARAYAGLYACNNGDVEHFDIRVVYLRADSDDEREFAEHVTAECARSALAFMLLCYTVRIETHLSRVQSRLLWAEGLAFPMAQYRPSQHAIARRVFQAIRGEQNLLLEAPTGSGKTLGVLYPALKAQGRDDQVFFLTSRNAGALAALAATGQLDPQRQALSVVQITAKQQTCFVEGMPCDPRRCAYAAGYFDRVGPAVDALLAAKRADREVVEAVARAHEACPFELFLDTALWADVVIGDYNYVFDPVVRLQRFAGHERLHLLIDEAHQLSPRARDMLTVRIDRTSVRAAKASAHAAAAKRAASLDRALLGLRREHGQGEHVVLQPESVVRACARLLETVAAEEVELEQYPELIELYFDAARWVRSDAWYSESAFEHLLQVDGRDIRLLRVCLDPADHLKSIYAEHGAVVRFSGTLTPLALYQRLHGETSDATERAVSPFAADQTLVMVVPDVPTYFKQREASLPKLTELVTDLVCAQPGRYIVALPSYAYLRSLAANACDAWGEVLVQTPGQNLEQTQALLDQFAGIERGVLFIVMGGVLGESVDFTRASLRGVMMVGLGLPPPSLERDLMQSYFDAREGDGWGRRVAYTQPALVKNIQAAGRLIRSESDVGVICLVDQRFESAEVQQFFPSHWAPQVVRKREVASKVTKFWQTKQA